MQLIIAPAQVYSTLKSLRYGFIIDWFGWQDWHVVTMTMDTHLSQAHRERLGSCLEALLGTYDGAVLQIDAGHCLAIVQTKEGVNVFGLETGIRQILDLESGEITARSFTVGKELGEIIICFNASFDILHAADETTQEPRPSFTWNVHYYDQLMDLWPKAEAQRKAREQTHILFVDDDELMRCIVGHTLKKKYDLTVAVDAVEALRNHILLAPDIVFLDIGLPDYNGLSLLQHFRQQDPQCKIVMFSGNHYFSNRLKAYAWGASGFIAKPFNKRIFKHYIDRCQATPDEQMVEAV